MEKTIVANAHTLAEVVQYARLNYDLIETAPTEREYIEQLKSLKESLILQYKPEVLGKMKDIPALDISNETSVRESFSILKAQSVMITEMSDSIIPMEFHLNKIRIVGDFLQIEIDYTWNIFGISYFGNKKVMKQFEKKFKRVVYLLWC